MDIHAYDKLPTQPHLLRCLACLIPQENFRLEQINLGITRIMRRMQKIQKTNLIVEVAKIPQILSTLIVIHQCINAQSCQRVN